MPNSSSAPDVFRSVVITETSADAFATEADLRMIFGVDFLRDYTTDLQSLGITNGVDFALEEAHQFVLSHLLHRYDEADLVNSRWVKYREARIAGYYLALRRGQSIPEGIVQAYTTAVEELESMASDTRRIIPGAKTRESPVPVVGNYEIDNRLVADRQRMKGYQTTDIHPGAKLSVDEIAGFPSVF